MSLWQALVVIAVAIAPGCKCNQDKAPTTSSGQAAGQTAGQSKTSWIAGKRVTAEYQIRYNNNNEQPPVTVVADVPESWTTTLSQRGAPSFAFEGWVGVKPTIIAIHSAAPDAEARMADVMAQQLGSGPPEVTKKQLDGGRVWATRVEAPYVSARMFVPAPNGAIVAIALIRHSLADHVDEIKSVFETVRLK